MRRRLVALTLGVALPTVLLGAGWLRASQRERSAMEREEKSRLERSADTIRAAVDEGLEELRRQEDARPFYLYNHFYSPPAVVAVSDPVAVSPLAREPTDARIVGYFQIDPDGTLRTPYTTSPQAPATERSRRVAEALSGPEFAAMHALAHAGSDTNSSLLAAADLHAAEPAAARIRRRIRRRRRPRPAPAPPATSEIPSAPGNSVLDNPLAPQGPLTVNLNTWGNQVFEDIQAAQAGSVEASSRVHARGRSAPLTRRRDVPWETYGASSQQAQSASRAEGVHAQGTGADSAILSNRTQQEAEVGYTDMAWYESGGELILHRVVSHGGVAVVQGVILDRDEIISHWLPALIRRHQVGDTPSVVAHGADASCSLRRQVAASLPTIDLCYPLDAMASATTAMEASQDLQLGALLGLLLIVGVALLAFDRAARRAEELVRQKSAFVSAVSHELRTPLTTIRMHAEMLREDLVSETRRPRVYDELVHESVRLSRLVDNVLEISRLENGGRPLRAERGDLRAHVAQAVSDHRPLVERKGFTVVEPVEGPPILLSFDRQAVEQIVANLLDNALKYAVSDWNEIVVRVESDGQRVLLSVRDHGPGIPEEEREAVFRRFHRIERADTAHSPGTGIGLSLVRDLAEAHGGSAEVHEAEGGGAEIVVALPLA